jgi:hypothetical protein
LREQANVDAGPVSTTSRAVSKPGTSPAITSSNHAITFMPRRCAFGITSPRTSYGP